MERITSEDREVLIDIESGRRISDEGANQNPVSGNRQANSFFRGLLGFNVSVGGECAVESSENSGETSEFAAGNVQVLMGRNSEGEESGEHMALVAKKNVKEKHKKTNYKMAPKPPRPPKGPSLDASDIMMVKEISSVVMKKRARNERMKALRKLKEAKSSSSSSSKSSLVPVVITILFFLVIIFKGFCSRGSSSVSFQGSPEPAIATNSLISVQLFNNPSSHDGSGPSSESPNSLEQTSGIKFKSLAG